MNWKEEKVMEQEMEGGECDGTGDGLEGGEGDGRGDG